MNIPTKPKSILSIQSHVVYGYVGNKAAVYPLQNMNFDVWPINTVQFSNHTGYQKWQGQIFNKQNIVDLVEGLFALGVEKQCQAILTGYMGSLDICEAVLEIVARFKRTNPDILYLCDPVMGNNRCFVKPEITSFFKNNLQADIITPNQFEAEFLSGIKINNVSDAIKVANHFHNLGVKIVIITGINFQDEKYFQVFASNATKKYLVQAHNKEKNIDISGTGDLFASLFLGFYLKYERNIKNALAHAVFYLNKVVLNTLLSQQKELQCLSVLYKQVNLAKLPQVMEIND
ncbi:pyridoxal kinase ['Santalum album' aster yellows phytoplasma]|uniref:pyridoxal kinase n=1 Tax='Santalum album' aster yellows phytoplasma TaxID=2831467 RepID=A0ABS5LKS0_9MOLU|nr:pyridoxal kinase ['Santalum album' aster yellows phytoplasma]MBS2993979.1 pyridoxal kinase ['Santalum album' aster yellows phytoplasma]